MILSVFLNPDMIPIIPLLDLWHLRIKRIKRDIFLPSFFISNFFQDDHYIGPAVNIWALGILLFFQDVLYIGPAVDIWALDIFLFFRMIIILVLHS